MFGILGSLISAEQQSLKEDKISTTAMLRFNDDKQRSPLKKVDPQAVMIVGDLELLKHAGQYWIHFYV